MLSGLQVVGRRTLTHADKKELPYITTVMEVQRNAVLRKIDKTQNKDYKFDLSSTLTSFWCESLLLFDLSLFSVFNIHNVISQEFLFWYLFQINTLVSRILHFMCCYILLKAVVKTVTE